MQNVEYLPWDTENFLFKTGRLHPGGQLSVDALGDIFSRAKSDGYELLYFSDADLPNEILAAFPFIRLADERVTYTAEGGIATTGTSLNVRSAFRTGLTPDLLSLALESGKYSRFRMDPNFSDAAFQTLYKLWIQRSLSGEYASEVLVYQEADRQVGLLTYHDTPSVVEIGLVAVLPDYAGRGIGTQLMQTFLSGVDSRKTVEVRTQKINSPACRFYEKNGFRVREISRIYHIWLNDYAGTRQN